LVEFRNANYFLGL